LKKGRFRQCGLARENRLPRDNEDLSPLRGEEGGDFSPSKQKFLWKQGISLYIQKQED